jgi:hypothetical protein
MDFNSVKEYKKAVKTFWQFRSHLGSSRYAVGLRIGRPGFDFGMVQVIFVVVDHEILSMRSFALYLCSGMYLSNQFLAKVKTASTGKLFDSIIAICNHAQVAELHFGKFKVA